MLRDKSLIPLSRQHHNGLALCVLSRRALEDDASAEGVAKVSRRVIDYYEIELANHFGIEEQVLFPLCGPLPIVGELAADHRAIEAMIESIREAPSVAVLEKFFTRLTGHIRREEREFFEEIQRTLPPELLDRTGGEIERRAARVCFY